MVQHTKIDVHSHFIPPEYRKACEECGHAKPDGMPAIPPWTEDNHLLLMELGNISKCILSISSPGTHLRAGDDEFTVAMTQTCNNVAAELKRRRPNQFGFWACLPLPDIEASLLEIARADDELNADGFTLYTNYHGTYLGNNAFNQVFDEINRRKGIVFIHPITPCLPSMVNAMPLPQFPAPVFEFLFDTARAIINLFTSGTVSRCPDIKFIVPHVGGAFPPLIKRFSAISRAVQFPGMDPNLTPDWVREKLNTQFYFDLAGWSVPEQIQGLLPHVTVDRILYGTDFPFTPISTVLQLAEELERQLQEPVPSEKDRDAIYTTTARKLLTSRVEGSLA